MAMAIEEGRRKLVAILAADVVGYTRLMADDERATIAALKDARSVFKDHIEAHAGRRHQIASEGLRPAGAGLCRFASPPS